MNHTSFSVIAACTLFAASSCGTSRQADVAPQADAAIFESFSYKGNDDFYAHNPLPDESSFYNPILPGWYSDPTICTNGEGDYFLATSTFTYVPGVPVFHSRDLVNWTKIGHVLTRESQLKNFRHQHVSGGIFAPDIKYNPANKTYYMITTNVGAGNFFVKTQDPFGEWSEPVYLPEVQGIDPSFFFDNDGRAYIVNNDDAPDYKPEYPGHRTVRIVEFDTETEKCIGERKIIVNKGCRPEEKPIWCEGPHIYNVDGTYYLMTAEGGTSGWHSEVIYRGKSPMGPFEPWEGNPILTQRDLDNNRPDPVTCAGHADLVKTAEGDWWAVFLACRPIDGDYENLGRETFMLPVKWTEDGWPYITKHGETIPMIVSRPGVTRTDSVTFGNFEWTDNFMSPSLDMEWHTLRGDAAGLYSLSATVNHLTLKCSEIPTTEKDVAAFVGRRVQHHNYECTTHMVFEPADTCQHAGLVVMKDETHQYQFAKSRNDDGNIMVLRKIDENGSTDIASMPLDADVTGVDLRLVSKGKSYDFMFSTDRGDTWETLMSGVDARHTSTAAAGGFTGTLVGLYASKTRI
ncbi:glycoside hydrolase family 43 protein [uncultured Duncaniella sp.]|uniref:glycoside hydrolase family 43 protein n=1 Tax=uncultured Duncaniella sp. TaxID=2768039 RepID=UPI0026E15C8D|nr:glycoside hydrolase family 43 protein [uncultured Duncaniella sp.]